MRRARLWCSRRASWPNTRILQMVTSRGTHTCKVRGACGMLCAMLSIFAAAVCPWRPGIPPCVAPTFASTVVVAASCPFGAAGCSVAPDMPLRLALVSGFSQISACSCRMEKSTEEILMMVGGRRGDRQEAIGKRMLVGQGLRLTKQGPRTRALQPPVVLSPPIFSSRLGCQWSMLFQFTGVRWMPSWHVATA
jgi:hypothetical protein